MDRPLPTRRSLVIAAGGMAVASTGALAQGTPAQATPPAPSKPGTLTAAPSSQAGLGPRLTLHAIDNFHGTPGAGMVCDLSIREGDTYRAIKTVTTSPTGRPADPLLVDAAFKPGRYELLMHFEDYFRALGVKLPSPNFLNLVPVRFVIRDATQRYHLPILFTPWGYSYYRGS